MNIIVTGIAGFIGQHLSDQLTKRGDNVFGISRNSSLSSDGRTSEKIKLIECDLSNFSKLRSIIQQLEPIDGIFHLAGQTYRKDSPGAEIYFKNNFQTTLNLLECCNEFKIPKLIFSSSIATYGLAPGQNPPKYLPVDEKHDITPFDFYDLSKYFSENLCKFYFERFGIITCALRYSRVYGPGLEKGLFFNVIKNGLSNKPVNLTGDISTDFVHVDDVVQANLAAFDKCTSFDIFNIGSGNEITLFEACKKILELLNSSSNINLDNKQSSRFSLDISKAKNSLDYSPMTIDEGIIDLIREFKKN